MNDPIAIVSAARTPIGGMLGDFSPLQAYQLGAVAIRAAVERLRLRLIECLRLPIKDCRL